MAGDSSGCLDVFATSMIGGAASGSSAMCSAIGLVGVVKTNAISATDQLTARASKPLALISLIVRLNELAESRAASELELSLRKPRRRCRRARRGNRLLIIGSYPRCSLLGGRQRFS
jgi:hypothetical protein